MAACHTLLAIPPVIVIIAKIYCQGEKRGEIRICSLAIQRPMIGLGKNRDLFFELYLHQAMWLACHE